MKPSVLFPTMALLLFACPMRAQVVNGGFETPGDISTYRVFTEGKELPGWVVEHGTVEIVGRYWKAAEGEQSLDLNGIFEQIGTIYQDVPTQAGQRYRVRFAFAGNPECGPKMKSFRVFWAGEEVTTLSFDTSNQGFTNMGWRYHEFVVAATGTTARLRFESLSPMFCGPTLDDVSVAPVDATMPTFREQLLRPTVATSVPSGGSRTPSSTATPASSSAAITASSTPATLHIQFCPVLTLFGPVGTAYQIESAEDLQSSPWTAVTKLTLTESPQLWIDLAATNRTQRFYRAVPIGQ